MSQNITINKDHDQQDASRRARGERNRQKALLIRQAKQSSKPIDDLSRTQKSSKTYTDKSIGVSYNVVSSFDTGGGFFLEDETDLSSIAKPIVPPHPAPILFTDRLFCEECSKEFQDSYLFNSFEKAVCDSCRLSNDQYSLITRTRAKDTYHLKDADLDRREPLLKFVLKPNPHYKRWGEMKLYLTCQIKERALDIWGSEDAIEEQTEVKSINRQKSKQKKFDKKVKELRNAVRSSLWTKKLGNHEHEYGDETYNDEKDVYTKTCSCGHTMTYEKM